jgi:hypothetical protein
MLKDQTYHALIEELQATIEEKGFEERIARVEMYHLIGKNIREFQTNVPVTELVKEITKDMNLNERNIWTAVRFYDTYPSIDMLPDGKAITWTAVRKLLNEKNDNTDQPLDLGKIARGIIKRYGIDNAKRIMELVSNMLSDAQN